MMAVKAVAIFPMVAVCLLGAGSYCYYVGCWVLGCSLPLEKKSIICAQPAPAQPSSVMAGSILCLNGYVGINIDQLPRSDGLDAAP